MKIYVKKIYKDGYYLTPVDLNSLDYIKKMSNDVYEVTIKITRNYKFFKKFWALIKVGHNNTKLDVPFKVYRKLKIMEAGYFKAYNTGKGVYYEAESISFDKMSEEKFQELYSRVLDKIIFEIGTTKEIIEKELAGFL